ncbi:MAG: hypothetical protein IPO88_29875 [Nannocystis sp.]|uniref:tetratricopeptide repeat protein n=1 Tax=Nannocystis sp. TaxID=1962667 RepID=UPI002429FC2F|nr:hypothetical protein [Nannocystis sp.]MBK9757642.1 hypothetical protein [Nannocystis sp.]
MTIAAAVVAFGVSAAISQIDLRGGTGALSGITPGVAARSGVAASGASYSALLAELDERIDGLQRRANKRPDDWLIRGSLGSALHERAGLTNQLADFDRVQAVLDEAFAIAPTGSGPLLVAARFNYSVHRLAGAEKYLDLMDRRAVPRGDEQLLARVLRAEIAVQRGQYEVAFKALGEVAAVAPVAAKAELALYHAKTGHSVEAQALLAETLASTDTNDPRRRAWIRLQLGIIAMERGELVVAMEQLRGADAELAGWWLVHEHIAEIHTRRANLDKAITIFEELVRTADLPQHMDALAGLYQRTGRAQEAEALITRAGARWEQQLARWPESAMGHSLQHHLQFGTPERALELALANEAARPGGEAQVLLALAYLRSDRAADALAVAERALATPYRTARLHDVAAKAHAALGHTAAAEEQVALCLAINPGYSSEDHSH